MISYKPLFHLLISRGMKASQLRKAIGASSSTFAKLQRGEYVSIPMLEKICGALHCTPNDVIEFEAEPAASAAREAEA